MKIKKLKGFTLVEVIIALLVSVIFMATLTKILIINKQSLFSQNGLEQIKNESSFALSAINKDVRSAGFKGCVSGVKNSANYINSQNVSTISTFGGNAFPIEGYNGSGSFSPALSTSLSSFLQLTPDSNFDILVVRNSTNSPYTLTSDMLTTTDNLQIPDSTGLVPNQFAIISNCSSNTLFNVGTVGSNYIQSTSGTGLTYVYPTGAQIYLWDTIVYFVNTSNGVSSLYRQINNNVPDLIATNVEKFSMLYGLDLNSSYNATQYVTADLVANYNNIINVKVGLVLKSNITSTGASKVTVTKNYSYIFNGTTVTPADGQIRKIYYSIITLRNMLP